MGSFSSKSIKVATANYSGITNSPFEFYSQNITELTRLNEIFKDLFSQIPQLTTDKVNVEKILITNTNYNKLVDKPGGGKSLDDKVEFDWQINNIQKSIQKGRYCTQYREDAGVQNCCFLKMDEFFKRWELQFAKNIKYVKVNEPGAKDLSLAKQKETCKVFDFLIFKTIVEYSYQCMYSSFRQQKWMQNYDKRITIKNRDTDSSRQSRTRRKHVLSYYEAFMQRYHRKPYLKHELKFKYIKTLIETHDVVFIQDSCDELINEIKNQGDYTIIQQFQDRDCYIIIKNSLKKFGQIYDAYKFMKDQTGQKNLFGVKAFNYSQITSPGNKCYPAICLVDRFLFMSIHLSSRKEKKYEQLIKFMDHILKIHERYEGELQIVVGGDFNSNIKHFMDEKEYKQLYGQKFDQQEYHKTILYKFSNVFYNYPENNQQNIITTRKKRTWLQSQAKKSDVNDEKSRDFLISNFQLKSFKVINNGTNMNDTLPTQRHPFDHFFISAEIGKTARSQQ